MLENEGTVHLRNDDLQPDCTCRSAGYRWHYALSREKRGSHRLLQPDKHPAWEDIHHHHNKQSPHGMDTDAGWRSPDLGLARQASLSVWSSQTDLLWQVLWVAFHKTGTSYRLENRKTIFKKDKNKPEPVEWLTLLTGKRLISLYQNMLLLSLLKNGDQLYQKMLLLNLLITDHFVI